ncbi:MAG: hypothetical protein ACR2OZ_05195 [Verrucomicrobiales bacterium]
MAAAGLNADSATGLFQRLFASEPHDVIDIEPYTPEGVRLWSTTVDSLEFQNDFTRALIIGPADEIFTVITIEDYDDDRLGTAYED